MELTLDRRDNADILTASGKLDSTTAGEFEAKVEEFDSAGHFARAVATWPTDLAHGDRFSFSGSSIAAVAGTPSLTVPMGETRGLPLGLAFLGDRNREAELLALGHAFELATPARTPPPVRPTAPPP